ncbi:unnamed protein product [Peniophora sp. CBMAI 1063]|nr:unnamed protein product [Peniophora sp. CBMAI 1063]
MGYYPDSDSASEGGTNWAPLVASLTELADTRPPYTAGTLPLPESTFHLHYTDANGEARVINLLSASGEQLHALRNACEPASFGRGGQDVMDDSYRKAGKLDASRFATPIVPERTDLARIVPDFLLEGEDNKTAIQMEMYKLNIYGKDSFFKAHVDTPRGERMLGSLVLVFPTAHSGGELVLRPETGDAYTFDSGKVLTPGDARIGFAAFFSDVAHEVLPVTDGHRITLTYNLYAVEAHPRVETPTTFSEIMTRCSDELSRILADETMLPDGGLLVFGLRHMYPVTTNTNIAKTSKWLKGVDRLLWNLLARMDLAPAMQLLYESYGWRDQDPRGLIGEVADLDNIEEEWDASDVVKREGTLKAEGISRKNVVWVTPVTKLTRIEQAHTTYGNEAQTDWAYADLCLIARVKSYAARSAA